jgi:O-antigen ligase
MLCFGPLAFGGVEPWAQTALFLLGTLTWLLTLGGTPSPKAAPDLRIIQILVLTVAFLGLTQALHPITHTSPSSLLPSSDSPLRTKQAILLWVSYALVLITGQKILGSPDCRTRTVWCIFILGCIISLVGLTQLGQGNPGYYGLRAIKHGSAFGPYTNRNHAATILNISLLLGSGLAFLHWRKMRSTFDNSLRWDRIAQLCLIAVLCALAAGGIARIHSRGALLSLAGSAAMTGLLALWAFAPRRQALLGSALGMAMFLGGGALIFKHYPILFGFSDDAFLSTDRLMMSRIGLAMALDFPVFGVGLGAVRDVIPFYQDYTILPGHTLHLHNDFVELLAETGMLGMTILLSLSVLLLKSIRAWGRCIRTEERVLRGSVLAAWLCFALHSAVDFSFQIPGNAVIFWALTLLLAQQSLAQT